MIRKEYVVWIAWGKKKNLKMLKIAFKLINIEMQNIDVQQLLKIISKMKQNLVILRLSWENTFLE